MAFDVPVPTWCVRLGEVQVSLVQVRDFLRCRGALWSMGNRDVHHNTWSGVGRCQMPATMNTACRIAGARARLLWDYRRDIACRRMF